MYHPLVGALYSRAVVVSSTRWQSHRQPKHTPMTERRSAFIYFTTLFLVLAFFALPVDCVNATQLLRRLYDAASERAAATRGSDSAVDVVAKAIDYARDQVDNPPMRAVEMNLLALRNGMKLLTEELRRLRLETNGDATCAACDLVDETTRLVRVQGIRYSEITEDSN